MCVLPRHYMDLEQGLLEGIEAFEMLPRRRLVKINWKDYKANEEVLQLMQEVYQWPAQ